MLRTRCMDSLPSNRSMIIDKACVSLRCGRKCKHSLIGLIGIHLWCYLRVNAGSASDYKTSGGIAQEITDILPRFSYTEKKRPFPISLDFLFVPFIWTRTLFLTMGIIYICNGTERTAANDPQVPQAVRMNVSQKRCVDSTCLNLFVRM